MRRPELLLVGLALVARLAGAEAEDAATPPPTAAPEKAPGFFGLGGARQKGPITITSDTLEYEYKEGVIVYRGGVLAVQGDVKVRSNELRITLAKDEDEKGGDKADGKGDKAAAKAEKASAPIDDMSAGRLRSVVASGSVRIDQGARWAVGGKATFEQSNRTLVLTEDPVLHDGPNEVAGDRVVVYLDQDRSVVEGGRKRVKAVIFPDKDKDGAGKTATPTAPAKPATAAGGTEPAR